MKYSVRWMLLAVAILAVMLVLLIEEPRRTMNAVAALERLNLDIVIERAHQWEDRPPRGNFIVRWLLGDDACEDVVTVDASMRNLTDDALTFVASFDELRELDICYNENITDAGLPALARLRNLQYLRLDRTGVTDAGMTCLGRMDALKGLYLVGTRVSDVGLIQISRLPRIADLDLSGTLVTDAGIVSLVKLDSLKRIELDDCQVGDPTAKVLSRLPCLSYISLSRTQITDDGIQEFAESKTIKRLVVTYTRVTQEAAAKLRERAPWIQVTTD